MAAFTTTLLALGTAASVAGSVVSSMGNQKAIAAQQEAEKIRRNSMIIDSQRRKREAIRQGQIVRANNVAAATNQGAGDQGSSALPGNYGGVAGRTNTTIQGINSNMTLGQQIFDVNQRVTDAYGLSAMGGTISSIGSGIASMGAQFAQSSEAISRIGAVAGTVGNTQGASYSSDPWAGVR